MIVIGLILNVKLKHVKMLQVIKLQNYYVNNGYLIVLLKILINVKLSPVKIIYILLI